MTRRASIRGRARDAAILLPFALAIAILPALLSGLRAALGPFWLAAYLFTVWAGAIGLAALLARRIGDADDGPTP